jgi:hypothetical protein
VAVTFAVLLAGHASGCDPDYPIAPTPCDDYCRATQRADCEDDLPHRCVAECEAVLYPHETPECHDAFVAWTECLTDAPDDRFACVSGRSRPALATCHVTQTSFYACTSSSTFRCYAFCTRSGPGCPAIVNTEECLYECTNWFLQCPRETSSYLDCALRLSESCAEEAELCAARHSHLGQCLDS